MEKLLEYLNSLSKESRATFVLACGTSEGYLRKAVSIGQQLGEGLCAAIDRESGGAVTRRDLRPDDWQTIWPELASKESRAHRKTDAPKYARKYPDPKISS